MERISINYTYERRSPFVVDVHGYVNVGDAVRFDDKGVAVFRNHENARWVVSETLALDEGGMENVELSDAIHYAREKIETRLRMRVIGGGSRTVAVAELDAFMQTHEPGNSREELSARVKDLTSRITMVEVDQGAWGSLSDRVSKLYDRVKKIEGEQE